MEGVFKDNNDKSASEWDQCNKASGWQSIGRSKEGLIAKIHIVTVSNRTAVGFSISGGQTQDAPIALLEKVLRKKEQ